MSASILTQERANELFNYNPDTGIVTRKIPTRAYKAGDAVGSDCHGYLLVTVAGTKYRLHRVIWLMVQGEFPPEQIDHIDGNRANNCLSNLRAVSAQENSRNRARESRNKSGVTGVSWHSTQECWYSHIYANGKSVYLGSFDDKDEAIAARKQAEKIYGYHPNHGRSS